jgi:O-antigen/teichoic acid export membrane protein
MTQQIKRQSLGKNMLFNSVGSLFYLVCQWLISVLSVRLASYEVCGVLTLAISITNFFYVIATFSLRVFQVSDTANKYPAGRYLSTRILTCLVGAGGCALFMLVNQQYTQNQRLCIIMYMVFKLSEALVDTLAAEQQKAWRMDYSCYSFLMRGAATLIIFIVTMLLWHDLLLTLTLMAAAAMLVVLVYDVPMTLRLVPLQVDFSCKRCTPLLREAWPMMLNGALMVLLASIPRYLLEMYEGSSTLGIYSSIAMPAVIIQTGSSFIYSPLVAPLSEQWTVGDLRGFRKNVFKTLGAILLMAAVVILGGAILGDWGLQLIYGESIADYTWQLPIVLLSTLSLALLYFFEVPLTIMRRLRIMSVLHGVGVLLVILASMILIPKMGMIGVSVSMIIAAGADAIAMGVTTYVLTGRLIRQAQK